MTSAPHRGDSWASRARGNRRREKMNKWRKACSGDCPSLWRGRIPKRGDAPAVELSRQRGASPLLAAWRTPSRSIPNSRNKTAASLWRLHTTRCLGSTSMASYPRRSKRHFPGAHQLVQSHTSIEIATVFLNLSPVDALAPVRTVERFRLNTFARSGTSTSISN